MAAAPAGDLCAGRSACQASGAFTTEVVRVSSQAKTTYANELLVTVGFRVTNHGAAPLVLGFVADSGQMLDEYGERYKVTYVYSGRVAGIGLVRRGSGVDPQFVLQPGEARPFTLGYSRIGAPSGARSYSVDVVLAQLELLPGNQVRIARENSISFPQLAGGGPAGGGGSAGAPAAPADAAQSIQELRNLFRMKRGWPRRVAEVARRATERCPRLTNTDVRSGSVCGWTCWPSCLRPRKQKSAS